MLKLKQEFIDYCADACDKGTFVTPKHAASGLPTPQPNPRSINCIDNAEMATYLRKGNFRVEAYSDIDKGHSPVLYIIRPNDPAIVPGSGVPAFSTTPTTQCDLFAVPSGYKQGFHGYAFDSQEVQKRQAGGVLNLESELL